MEKTVLVEAHVEDLCGLYIDLRKASFLVKNVATDRRGTYVYLDPSEEKDPSPIVENWKGKAAPKPSLLLRDIRIKEIEKVEADEKKRVKIENVSPVAVEEENEREKRVNSGFFFRKGLFRKILGKFF